MKAHVKITFVPLLVALFWFVGNGLSLSTNAAPNGAKGSAHTATSASTTGSVQMDHGTRPGTTDKAKVSADTATSASARGSVAIDHESPPPAGQSDGSKNKVQTFADAVLSGTATAFVEADLPGEEMEPPESEPPDRWALIPYTTKFEIEDLRRDRRRLREILRSRLDAVEDRSPELVADVTAQFEAEFAAEIEAQHQRGRKIREAVRHIRENRPVRTQAKQVREEIEGTHATLKVEQQKLRAELKDRPREQREELQDEFRGQRREVIEGLRDNRVEIRQNLLGN